uniref:Secreted protein n=1 Tax=Acrobeloides nanus TaxID=290746 RepID=A0A914DP40_9BILA
MSVDLYLLCHLQQWIVVAVHVVEFGMNGRAGQPVQAPHATLVIQSQEIECVPQTFVHAHVKVQLLKNNLVQ